MMITGLEDPTWLDGTVAWLQRPAFEVVAGIGALLAGIFVLLRSRNSAEIAWLFLVLSVTALGPEAGLLAAAGLGGAVVFLSIRTIVAKASGEREGRVWFGVPIVFERAIIGVFEWALTPFAPLLRLGDALIDTVSAERRTEAPTGAIPIVRTELS